MREQRQGTRRSCHGRSSGDQNATLRERAKITFEGPRRSLRLRPTCDDDDDDDDFSLSLSIPSSLYRSRSLFPFSLYSVIALSLSLSLSLSDIT